MATDKIGMAVASRSSQAELKRPQLQYIFKTPAAVKTPARAVK